MNVLTIANQKGGVGKTTTAAALAVLLSRAGNRVHVIDMDPQSNLTETFGLQDPESLLFEALSKRGPLPVVPIQDNLTLTPSSIDLGAVSFSSWPRPVASSSSDAALSALSWGRGRSSSSIAHPRSGSSP